MISETLKQFYQTILIFIEEGTEHELDRGLCSTLNSWLLYNKYETVVIKQVREEQTNLFIKEHGNHLYPFNPRGEPGYLREQQFGSLYENPKRLAFIKKYAGVKS